MKKGDIIIIISVLSISLASFLFFIMGGNKAETVTVKKNEKLIYSGSLFENKVIDTNGNMVEIKNGKVQVVYADCKNQICANHRAINKKGENIICLPNKVIVEIK